MTLPLVQRDIDGLAAQIDRLALLLNGVAKRVTDQETVLENIHQQMTSKLAPVVDKLDGFFEKAEVADQEILDAVNKTDNEVGEIAQTLQDTLTALLENPPVGESLELFDQAIETAQEVNEELHGRLTALAEIVEGAEADVIAAFDALSDKTVELTDDLISSLTAEATLLTEKMANSVFGPIQATLTDMTEALQALAGENISEVLNTQIERLGAEVAEQLDKVIAFLKNAIEEMMDKIANQLEQDTAKEQSARAVLEQAVAPLEPVMDTVKEAYNVFKGIADSVGVSLPDLD